MLLSQMLARKEALVIVLRDLNGQAETIAASSSSHRHPDLYPPVFRQQYGWVVNALNKTNAALTPALQRLRQLVNQNGGGGGGGASGAEGLDVYHGVRLSSTVKSVMESSQDLALSLYQRHRVTKIDDTLSSQAMLSPETAPLPPAIAEGGSIENLVQACASLMLVLRQCADHRKTNTMTAMDVEQCVGAALEELRYRCQAHGQLFQNIENSVTMLKNDLLL